MQYGQIRTRREKSCYPHWSYDMFCAAVSKNFLTDPTCRVVSDPDSLLICTKEDVVWHSADDV